MFLQEERHNGSLYSGKPEKRLKQVNLLQGLERLAI
jgi:hypothetical protein